MRFPSERTKIFGTDGVRGKANLMPMTVEVALYLGRAVGKIFRSSSGRRRVVVGKDTRLSCYMIENALISGLCSMGVNTLMLGPFPTPGVAFITRAYRADAGVVISASHNNFSDNGIKFFSAEGFKLPDSLEAEIEELVFSGNFEDALPPEDGIGRNSRVHDADGRYIEFVKATFPRHLSLKGMKIALDCANGAAYKVAPLIFFELGADMFVVGDEPNGLNINLNCGSLYPQLIQTRVIETQSDVGIALDGDGDRLIMIDENAQIIDGDVIMAIIAKHKKEEGKLKNNAVVATVMSNLGFIRAMEREGIAVHLSQVGDRYVIQEMLDKKACLGGEQSGHIICLDHNTTGDALIAALEVLAIMKERDLPLSQLAKEFEKYPQTLVNVKVKNKPPLHTLPRLKGEIESVEMQLGKEGRVLVRYSGTENLLRVMVEGADAKRIAQCAQLIAETAKAEIGSA